MADNLGLSLGLQVIPKDYSNIYLAGLKEQGQRQAEERKRNALMEEASNKFASDIKINPKLFHKSQEDKLRSLTSDYIQQGLDLKKKFPYTAANYFPQLKANYDIEVAKMQQQAKNYNDLLKIPESKLTSAQKDIVKKLNSGESIEDYYDPTGSVVVSDGYITPQYLLNPDKTDIQSALMKKFRDIKDQQVGDMRMQGRINDNEVYTLGKTQFDPKVVPIVLKQALIADPDLINSAKEMIRPQIVELDKRAKAENWTAQRMTDEVNNAILNALTPIANEANKNTFQYEFRKPSQGNIGGLGNVQVAETIPDYIEHGTKNFYTDPDNPEKTVYENGKPKLNEVTPIVTENIPTEKVILTKPLRGGHSFTKYYDANPVNEDKQGTKTPNEEAGAWHKKPLYLTLNSQELVKVPFYKSPSGLFRMATNDELKAGKNIVDKILIPIANGKFVDYDEVKGAAPIAGSKQTTTAPAATRKDWSQYKRK